MPEIVNGKKQFLLSEFTSSLQRAIAKYYNNLYWIKAEISKLNYFPKSGHCYPELVENTNGKITAVCNAFIEKNIYTSLDRKFVATVGEPLHDGMKVVLLCKLCFSNTRGVRLEIRDIDINSLIGEQERIRLNTITSLKSEGIFARNKIHTLPHIINNIAIVSVESGKGYADFSTIIKTASSIKFNIVLFSAQMTGTMAAANITNALQKIKNQYEKFDAVCIIRGGGGESSLQCFNDTTLAREVATFPLPVLTGIGHVTNNTVVEEIAYKSFVSPSDLATFLVEERKKELTRFCNITTNIATLMQRSIYNKARQLDIPCNNLHYKFDVIFARKEQKKDICTTRIFRLLAYLLQKKQQLVDDIGRRIHNGTKKTMEMRAANVERMKMIAEPVNDFKIMINGKFANSIRNAKEGDVIRLFTNDGVVTANITSVNIKN